MLSHLATVKEKKENISLVRDPSIRALQATLGSTLEEITIYSARHELAPWRILDILLAGLFIFLAGRPIPPNSLSMLSPYRSLAAGLSFACSAPSKRTLAPVLY